MKKLGITPVVIFIFEGKWNFYIEKPKSELQRRMGLNQKIYLLIKMNNKTMLFNLTCHLIFF